MVRQLGDYVQCGTLALFGFQSAYPVSFRSFLTLGNARQMPDMRPNDIIYLTNVGGGMDPTIRRKHKQFQWVTFSPPWRLDPHVGVCKLGTYMANGRGVQGTGQAFRRNRREMEAF